MTDLDPARRSFIAVPLALAVSRASALQADPLLLTDAQRDWIRDHPVVRFTVSFEARPFLFLEGGRPAGYVVDPVAKAARLTGLRFEYVASRDRDDALRRLAAGEIELVPLMRIDDSRRGRVPLTQPVATFTPGIFTRTDAPHVDGLADLAGRRVGMPRGMAQGLRFDEPVPRFEPLDSTVDGIRGLFDGRYDAVVAPVPVAQHWIRRLGTDAAWLQAMLDAWTTPPRGLERGGDRGCGRVSGRRDGGAGAAAPAGVRERGACRDARRFGCRARRQARRRAGADPPLRPSARCTAAVFASPRSEAQPDRRGRAPAGAAPTSSR